MMVGVVRSRVWEYVRSSWQRRDATWFAAILAVQHGLPGSTAAAGAAAAIIHLEGSNRVQQDPAHARHAAPKRNRGI